MLFGETLDMVMRDLGIDAVTLSERSGVSTPYISKIRSGKTKDPSWPKALALIGALGMTPSEFALLQEGVREKEDEC